MKESAVRSTSPLSTLSTELLAGRMRSRLQELDEAFTQAKQGLQPWAKVRQLAHKVKGAGGMLGYARVGEAAGLIEDLLIRLEAEEEKNPDRGTLARLETAFGDAHTASLQSPVEYSTGTSGRVHATGKTLLFVDDDADIRRWVRDVGMRFLLNIETVPSVAEGVEIARKIPLCGALLDVHLGVETSFVLASQIRQVGRSARETGRDLPIAFCSADTGVGVRLRAIDAGASLFVEKPLTEEALRSIYANFNEIHAPVRGKVTIVSEGGVEAETVALHALGVRATVIRPTQSLFEEFERNKPDVLIVDTELSQFSAADICRLIRSSVRWELLPVIVLSPVQDREVRLKHYQAGAWDVLEKPILREELGSRVLHHLSRISLLREKHDTDPLSGLLLRRAFVEALRRGVSACERQQLPLSIALIDVDEFKKVNDKYGHEKGDEVLAFLGELIRQRFRAYDLKGRWGGEEFILAFQGQRIDFAQRAVTSLLQDFSASRFSANDITFSVNFTAGISEYPRDASSVSALVRCADDRLYHGKRTGRARVVASTEADIQRT